MARRSTAAASAEPPPRPADTGMCFSIVMRTGGPSHPKRLRNALRAAAARFGPRTPGQTTSSVAPLAFSIVTSSASVIG